MSTMKALILKDLLNLQKYLKVICLSLVFICMYGFFSEGFELFTAIMPVMVVAMSSFSTFNYDELSKADKYILSLPTTRKDIVRARYLLIAIVTFIGAVVSLVVSVAASSFTTKQLPNFGALLFNSALAFFLFALVGSLQIPCLYKFGPEKGRIFMMVIIAAVSAISAGGYFFLRQSNVNLETSGLTFLTETPALLLFIIVAAVLYYLSYLISKRIYATKEL